jgi:hypothetical protein
MGLPRQVFLLRRRGYDRVKCRRIRNGRIFHANCRAVLWIRLLSREWRVVRQRLVRLHDRLLAATNN